MPKIFKASNTGAAEWFSPKSASEQPPQPLSRDEALAIQKLPASIDEDGLAGQCDCIEQVASAGGTYYYSKHWGDDVKSSIREYAIVCGCSAKEVDPKGEDISREASVEPASEQDETLKKFASAGQAQSTLEIQDPFHLGAAGDMSHMAKSDWQKVVPEAKLSKPTAATRGAAVTAIGGGEDHLKSPHLHVRPGQNSVTTPDAIATLISGKAEDAGARLRRESKEHDAERAIAKKDWERSAAKKAQECAVPPGMLRSVIQTEAKGEQGGFIGIKTVFEDRTAGEKIQGANDLRKLSIQRERNADVKERDKPQGQATPSVSDAFAESLKATLGIQKK